MSIFKLNILGSGSALPKNHAFPTSQVLEMREKQFMIDCGEGAQIRMRQYKVGYSRLNHIFISHLHGDHCFGLLGLLSSLGMLGRTSDITIHAHPDLEKLISCQINYFLRDFPFQVHFDNFSPFSSDIIYEDKSVSVRTLPLKHRVPCSGFLFEEKASGRHLVRQMLDAYEIPISQFNKIKEGADFVTPDGEVVPNSRLTREPEPPKKFAYMSDTAYSEKNIDVVEGADCLYHESTFLSCDTARIKDTLHSSAAQAAAFAAKANVKQLIIGHYSARYNDTNLFLDEAKRIFANTFAAKDGDTFEF